MRRLLTMYFIVLCSICHCLGTDTNNDPPTHPIGGGTGRKVIEFPTIYYHANINSLNISWNQIEECQLVITNQLDNVLFSTDLITDGQFHFYPLPNLYSGEYKLEFLISDEIVCYYYVNFP